MPEDVRKGGIIGLFNEANAPRPARAADFNAPRPVALLVCGYGRLGAPKQPGDCLRSGGWLRRLLLDGYVVNMVSHRSVHDDAKVDDMVSDVLDALHALREVAHYGGNPEQVVVVGVGEGVHVAAAAAVSSGARSAVRGAILLTGPDLGDYGLASAAQSCKARDVGRDGVPPVLVVQGQFASEGMKSWAAQLRTDVEGAGARFASVEVPGADSAEDIRCSSVGGQLSAFAVQWFASAVAPPPVRSLCHGDHARPPVALIHPVTPKPMPVPIGVKDPILFDGVFQPTSAMPKSQPAR